MLFGKIAHKELFHLQTAGIPPREPNQESIGAGAPREAGGFCVKEQPFFRVLQSGARLAGEGLVAAAGKQFERGGRRLGKFGSGEPVPNSEVFAEMIPGHASSEEAAESVFIAGGSYGGGPRGHWPGGLQRGETREFIGA